MRSKPYSRGQATKHCPKCDKMRSIENFSKSERALSGLQTYCKPCTVKTAREYHRKNPERRRAIEKASRLKHAAPHQWRTIQKRAAVKNIPTCSTEEFKKWFAEQKSECVYCHTTNEEAMNAYNHRLHIDRKISSLGYVVGNMVFACQRCNLVKSGYLTYEQMKEVAEKYFCAKAKGGE